MTVVSVSRVAAHRWSPNDRNIGTINSPLAAGSAIEVDRLPVLVNHPRPLLHERGAGGQLAHLSSGHQSCKRISVKIPQSRRRPRRRRRDHKGRVALRHYARPSL